jgi:hypothetical protein
MYWTRQGVGPYCYGCGCSTGSIGNPSCTGDGGQGCTEWCYDPLAADVKGEHSYPYVNQVMAFDLAHLADAYAGTITPRQVRPYAVWYPTVRFTPNRLYSHGSVAYDPTTRRVYAYQTFTDGDLGVVEVWELSALSNGGDTTAPAAPTNLHIVQP